MKLARAYKNCREQFQNQPLKKYLDSKPQKFLIDNELRVGTNEHLKIAQKNNNKLAESLLIWQCTETDINYSRKPYI